MPLKNTSGLVVVLELMWVSDLAPLCPTNPLAPIVDDEHWVNGVIANIGGRQEFF
jgi:hypothetical protein